jgi:hypothetical protein
MLYVMSLQKPFSWTVNRYNLTVSARLPARPQIADISLRRTKVPRWEQTLVVPVASTS